MKIKPDKLFAFKSRSKTDHYYWFYQQVNGQLGAIKYAKGFSKKWRIINNIRYGDMRLLDKDVIEIKGSDVSIDVLRIILEATFVARLS